MNRLFFKQSLMLFICLLLSYSFLNAREHINLTNWKFQKGIIYNAQKRDFNTSLWEKVNVPHTYSMDAINSIGYYRGEAWYRTIVKIPDSMKGERIFIRFEAVGNQAQIFVNEKFVGSHAGGYSAFCFEITNFVTVGKENLVAVKVTNEPDFKIIPVDDKLSNLYGGVYRPVQIFSTPQCDISPVYFASPGVFVELKELKDDVAKLEIRTHISNSSDAKTAQLTYKILNTNNKTVLENIKSISDLGKDTVISTFIYIKNPILWNGRKNPYLYRVDVSLNSGSETDKVSQAFGIKTFFVNTEKGSFLNNELYRLYGVAMHQDWKQCGPALSDEQHRKDMSIVDEIGATVVRLSHYQHSDLTYQLADEKGILVWAEIPFVHDYSGREGDNAKQQLNELILQNYNHPSIFVWGIWNEVRAYNSPNEPCVSLTKELVELAHQLDHTRLTTSASDRDIISNMGNITDLQAWNKYFGWYYGKYEDLASWLDDAHKNYPNIAIGISEYGAGGNIMCQDTTLLDKPFGNHFPEQDQTRCHEISWKIIKDRPYIWCSMVWNMFDFSVAGWNRGGVPNMNHKGLVTYDREVKKDAFYFYKANWSNEPVLYIEGRRNNVRHSPVVEVKVYSNLASPVSLWLNGQKIATKKQDSEIKIVTFNDVKLIDGENTIRVVSTDQKYNDEVKWTLKQNEK